MKDKKVVVCAKFYKGELNPFDGSALECALELGAKEVIVLSMAPPSSEPSLSAITRLNVKCVMVSDGAYAGSDTQATSLVLAEAIKRLNPDVIFCGRQSVDGDTAQIPPMLSQRLGFNLQSKVIEINEKGFALRDGKKGDWKEKTIYTFEKIKALRFPSIFSKIGKVEVWDNSLLNLPKEKCGLLGSPTRVIKSYESTVGRRDCKFVSFDQLGRLIEQGLEKETIKKTSTTQEKVQEIYYVGNIKETALSIAKNGVEIDVNGKSPEEIARELIDKSAKIVLWEDSEELKMIASKVAVLTGAGICADCISFRLENDKFVMTRPAFGGNVTADIIATSSMAFATVRTVKNGQSQVVFSVGKGCVDKKEKISELAKKYGAERACSRIVADSGKLPYEMQVGLTGKVVSPKVYVAFGISGAVQHTCAIAGAGTIIAINCDKDARIFDYADYGIIKEF